MIRPIRTIAFPPDEGQRYYESHFKFFKNLAEAAGTAVHIVSLPTVGRGFVVRANGKLMLIDLGDHFTTDPKLNEFDLCFRYHYSESRHGAEPATFPLTPISFYDWDEYQMLQGTLRYRALSDMVLNNQKPGAAAKVRRTVVQVKLRKRYGAMFDTARTTKQTFWGKVKNCLVSVCVPGARDDILDRGQLQYWAFGACTISPKINIVLPWGQSPQPGVHYVECAADHSDIIEKIEWCRSNRDACRRIGAAAKELFIACCVPQAVWKWIEHCAAKGKEA